MFRVLASFLMSVVLSPSSVANAVESSLGITSSETQRVDIFSAAESGQIDQIQAALIAGQGINSTDTEGKSPLMLAAKSGRLKAVEFLYLRGGDINQHYEPLDDFDKEAGFTPIYFAAENGRQEVVNYLLSKKGVEISHVYRAKEISAMDAALDSNNPDTAILFVEKETTPRRDEYVFRWLSIASSNNWDDVDSFSVAYMNYWNEAYEYIHYQKGNKGNAPIAFDKSEILSRALIYAAQNGRLRALRFYVSEGARLGKKDGAGKDARTIAADVGCFKCVEFLNEKFDIK